MNDATYKRIESNACFKELVAKRERFAWILSIIMLVLYFGFVLLIAFAPEWLGTPISENSHITRGIPMGIGLIVISFILTGVYTYRANGEFDRLNNQVLREVSQ